MTCCVRSFDGARLQHTGQRRGTVQTAAVQRRGASMGLAGTCHVAGGGATIAILLDASDEYRDVIAITIPEAE